MIPGISLDIFQSIIRMFPRSAQSPYLWAMNQWWLVPSKLCRTMPTIATGCSLPRLHFKCIHLSQVLELHPPDLKNPTGEANVLRAMVVEYFGRLPVSMPQVCG